MSPHGTRGASRGVRLCLLRRQQVVGLEQDQVVDEGIDRAQQQRARQHLGVPDPLLQHLRWGFDEIARHAGAGETAIAGASHDRVHRVAEFVGEHHPDRHIAAGVPEEMVEIATRRLQKINEAYERMLKTSHTFNLLDARKAISVTERQRYILRARLRCSSFLEWLAKLGYRSMCLLSSEDLRLTYT